MLTGRMPQSSLRVTNLQESDCRRVSCHPVMGLAQSEDPAPVSTAAGGDGGGGPVPELCDGGAAARDDSRRLMRARATRLAPGGLQPQPIIGRRANGTINQTGDGAARARQTGQTG